MPDPVVCNFDRLKDIYGTQTGIYTTPQPANWMTDPGNDHRFKAKECVIFVTLGARSEVPRRGG